MGELWWKNADDSIVRIEFEDLGEKFQIGSYASRFSFPPSGKGAVAFEAIILTDVKKAKASGNEEAYREKTEMAFLERAGMSGDWAHSRGELEMVIAQKAKHAARATVHSLPSHSTDAQKAEDYRTRLKPVLGQAVAIITEARREGLMVGFNLMPDQFGIQRVGEISVTKPL